MAATARITLARLSVNSARSLERISSQSHVGGKAANVSGSHSHPTMVKRVPCAKQSVSSARKDDGWNSDFAAGMELVRLAAFNRWLIRSYEVAVARPVSRPKPRGRTKPAPYEISAATVVPQTAGDFAAEVKVHSFANLDASELAKTLSRHQVLILRNCPLSNSNCAVLQAGLNRALRSSCTVSVARVDGEEADGETVFAAYEPLKSLSPDMQRLVSKMQMQGTEIDYESMDTCYVRAKALDARMAWRCAASKYDVVVWDNSRIARLR